MKIIGTCPKDLLPKDKCQVSLPVVKGFVQGLNFQRVKPIPQHEGLELAG